MVNTDGNQWPFANYTIKDDVVVYQENADNLVFIIPKLSSVGCRVMVQITILFLLIFSCLA